MVLISASFNWSFFISKLGCFNDMGLVGEPHLQDSCSWQISSCPPPIVSHYLSSSGPSWFTVSFPHHFQAQVFLQWKQGVHRDGKAEMLPVCRARFVPCSSTGSLSLRKPWALKSPRGSWVTLSSWPMLNFVLFLLIVPEPLTWHPPWLSFLVIAIRHLYSSMQEAVVLRVVGTLANTFCLTVWKQCVFKNYDIHVFSFNFSPSLSPFTILPIKLERWNRNQSKEK